MSIIRRILGSLSTLADRVFQDGLDTREYVSRLEREFSIVLRAEEASQLKTLGDLCHLIAEQVRRNGAPLPEEEIWSRVRDISSDELGIDPSELHRGVRFVEDLCF